MTGTLLFAVQLHRGLYYVYDEVEEYSESCIRKETTIVSKLFKYFIYGVSNGTINIDLLISS